MVTEEQIINKINGKTKPLGSLGNLEIIASQLCKIQNTLEPKLEKPVIIVYAGDHGIAKEGVSPYPQEVTYQMVYNFLNNGAAINVFGKQNGIEIKVVDAGVNFDFPPSPYLFNLKIKKGTESYLTKPAMTSDECMLAIEKARDFTQLVINRGTNIVGCGEMGIGNTSSASIIMSLICNIPLEECIGRGTGLTPDGLKHKTAILKKAIKNNPVNCEDPYEILRTFGGFEIAMMVGTFLEAFERNIAIMVDGFIATSAALIATKINPKITDNFIYTHQSDEQGHRAMLQYLNATPLLSINMRLGEGTGCAVGYPIIKSAVAFINEMASFESAGVSKDQE